MKRVGLVLLFPFVAVAALLTVLRFAMVLWANPAKAWSIAKMQDVALNVAANGQPYTTISSRAARAQLRGARWGCVLCKLLNAIDKNHCKDSL